MPLYTEDYNNPLQFRILGYFKQRLFNPPLKIVNNFETINYTKSYKYQGLILNETLNMSEHMKVTMKKARSRVNLLKRIWPLIDADTASLIFKVITLPISTYCPYSTFGNIPNYVKKRFKISKAMLKRSLANHYLIVWRTFKNNVLQHMFTSV